MAISRTWQSAIGQINGNSVTCILPASSTVAGDVVVAWGGHPQRANTNIGPASALGYSVVDTNEGTNPNFGVWYKYQGTTPDSSVTLVGSGSSLDATAYGVYIFRGVASVVLDNTATVAGPTSGTNPAPPAVISLSDNDWAVVLAGSDATDAAITSVAGYSSLVQATGNDNNDMTIGGNLKPLTSRGTETPGTYNDWATGNWFAVTLALRNNTITVPTITTSVITEITQTTATGGGNVSADGGSNILERGVVWNTSTNPDTTNSKADTAGTTGSYQSSITGLTANTQYYARAFAINALGSVYGVNSIFGSSSIIGQTNFQFNGTGNQSFINSYNY